MAGVRVQHPTERNVRFTITDPTQPYPDGWYSCTAPEYGGCGRVHTHKTHHLNLDETGAAIVDAALYDRVKGYLFAFGFTETNVVAKPPTIGIGLGQGIGAWGNIPIVRGEGDG